MIRLLDQRLSRLPPGLGGTLLAVAASACFASMHNIIRYVSADVHPFQIAFFRNLFGVLVFVPWLATVGFSTLRTERIWTHVARGAANSLSMLAWFSALALIPVANATSLSLVGPVFVTLGAVLVFKEKVGPHRWLGVIVGILGALIIVRPGFVSVGIAPALILFATFCVSVSKLIAKSLARTDSTPTIVAYLTFLMMVFTLIPALFVWEPVGLRYIALLAVVGTFGTTGHLFFIKAYKLADVSLVEPVMFMRVIFAAFIGLIVFAEFPDIWTWVGAAVIVGGNTYMARREAVKAQHTAETLP